MHFACPVSGSHWESLGIFHTDKHLPIVINKIISDILDRQYKAMFNAKKLVNKSKTFVQ